MDLLDRLIKGDNEDILTFTDIGFIQSLESLDFFKNIHHLSTFSLEYIKFQQKKDIILKAPLIMPGNDIHYICIFVSFPLEIHIIEQLKLLLRESLQICRNDNISICIFSSIAQEFYPITEDTISTPYQHIKSLFLPFQISNVFHLPVQIIPIVRSTTNSSNSHIMNVFCLSSPICRDLFHVPSSKEFDSEDVLDSIDNQLTGNDLESDPIVNLMSHELISSLIFDYGIDVSKHIFTMGQMSEVVGRKVQKLFPDFMEYTDSLSPKMKSILMRIKLNKVDVSNLQKGSLILIDRSEDLFTCCSHGSSSTAKTPLAHRILCAIKSIKANKKMIKSCNIELDPVILSTHVEIVENIDASEVKEEKDSLELPFSALHSISFSMKPSLLPLGIHANTTSDRIRELVYHMFCSSEDVTKEKLCNTLKLVIEEELGSLPSSSKKSKRGFGAEILALTQALLTCPGRKSLPSLESMIHSLGYNPRICLQHEHLISLVYAVIEAMQRSSAKQFAQVTQSFASYDSKCIREDILLSNLKSHVNNQDTFQSLFSIGLSCLTKWIQTYNQESVNTSTIPSPSKAKGSAATDGLSSGPIDIGFIFLQYIRIVSLVATSTELYESNHSEDTAAISQFASVVANYLIHNSPKEELEYLESLNIIHYEISQEIISLRVSLTANESVSDDFEDDWDPIDDNDDNELKAKKLLLEVHDIILNIFERLQTVYSNRTKPNNITTSKELNIFECSDLIESYLIPSIQPNEPLASGGFGGENLGVLARVLLGICQHKQRNNIKDFSLTQSVKHMESNIEKIKRAGMGLLTSGLGRLGLGAAIKTKKPHPADHENIVIFVIGGLSVIEIGQLQAVLAFYDQQTHLIFGSNSIFLPNDVLKHV